MIDLKEILLDHLAWLDGKEGGKRADLHGADLHGADLRGADLQEADLRSADLRGADLQDADLHGADLRGADLQEADLQRADLHGAYLHGADLHGADLRGADLQEADLRDSYLHGADLRGAILTGTGIAVYQTGQWIACIASDSIRIGCEFHSTEDWRTFDDGTIREMHPDALDYWRENKDAILLIADKLKEKDRG